MHLLPGEVDHQLKRFVGEKDHGRTNESSPGHVSLGDVWGKALN